MSYNRDITRNIFVKNYAEDNIPGEVIDRLTDYTVSRHSPSGNKNPYTIYEDIESIFFKGRFSSYEEAAAKMGRAMFIYDNYIADHEGSYYLFHFYVKP